MTHAADTPSRPDIRAVVEELLRRSIQGDPEHIAQLYAPKVSWRVNWPAETHPSVPWIRPRSTRADVADHYRTFPQHCPPADAQVTIDDILIAGSDAVLFGTSSQHVVATGNDFTMTFALRLTIKNGRITHHHMYEDTLSVQTAFNPS